MRIHTPVRRQAPTEEVELRELLDRILDKGLFLGSVNMLSLSETTLSASGKHFIVSPTEAEARLPETKPPRSNPRRGK
ncbi:MAG: hypothetical protein ACM3SW_17330 [Actinomycetota bacterium]